MGNILDCGTSQSAPAEVANEPKLTDTNAFAAIETKSPLLNSMIWKLQREYYIQNNIQAWVNMIVPCFVTSNSFIAKEYASIILRFITDWYSSPEADPNEPIYIFEAGAGHGKLGYLIIKRLLEMKDLWPDNVEKPFVYILSDFTASTIRYWSTHPLLQKYVEQGYLDYSKFDCEYDNIINLEISGKQLSPGNVKNPMFVVCNYIFDSLKQDSYVIEDGKLYRQLVTLHSSQQEPDLTIPDVLSRLKYTWTNEFIPDDMKPTTNENINNILTWYKKNLPNSAILIPTGAISFINTIRIITGNKAVFLVGDKGFTTPEDLSASREPHLAQHGSISFTINMHALDLYFQAQSGHTYASSYIDGFKVCMYTVGLQQESIQRTVWAFVHNMASFSPDSFSVLQRCIKDETSPSPSLKHVLSLLRLSNFDTDIFFKFKQVMIDRGGYACASASLQQDVLRDLNKIREEYYPIQKYRDVSFELGRMHMGLKEYKTAIELFKESNTYCAQHHVTWHNMGMCYNHLGDIENAKKCFQNSIDLKPSYREARTWLAKMNALTSNTPAILPGNQSTTVSDTNTKPIPSMDANVINQNADIIVEAVDEDTNTSSSVTETLNTSTTVSSEPITGPVASSDIVVTPTNPETQNSILVEDNATVQKPIGIHEIQEETD